MEDRKIKILHVVIDMGHGGYENLLMNIYRNIDREKYEFDFLTFKSHEAYFEKEIIELGGKVFHVPFSEDKNLIKSRRTLKRIISENSFDILHCHNRYYGFVYLPILKKKIKHIIIHSHSASYSKDLKGRLVHILEKYISKKKYHNVAVSTLAGEHAFGKNNNYDLLPNCIETEKFKYDENARNELRIKYGIRQDSFVIGHIGRFAPVKNHKFILEIFEKVSKTNSNSILCLCGVGALKKQIIDAVNQNSTLKNKVVFLEPGDVSKYYSMFDLFILPSFFEGFPLSLLESQASGCYSLSSDTVTKEALLTDIVKYLPIDDVNIWVKEIEHQINNRAICRALYNDKIKATKYDVKNATQLFVDYYQKIMKE